MAAYKTHKAVGQNATLLSTVIRARNKMGNKAMKCCATNNDPAGHGLGGKKPKRRKPVSSTGASTGGSESGQETSSSHGSDEDAGMNPPFPALEVLRDDVTAAQDWLDNTLVQISNLELCSSPPSGRPPDDKKKRKDADKVKFLVKDFLKRSFETDELLSHSHAWLDQDNYKDTTFDLDIARLEYAWSQVRDKLAELARVYQCPELQSELARDLSAQGGDGFSPSQSTSTPRSRLLNRRSTNPDATQGHQPKQKRKFIPHLTWQYRAVIKSNVKFRDRTPRGSILGSEAPSEAGSIYDGEPLFTLNRGLNQGSQSSSLLSLPTVVGPGTSSYGDGSSSSLPTLSDAERRALFTPGYKDDPSSDSLVSRDLNSNTVRVKQHIKAIRARKQRRLPSNQLSLVRYGSGSSSDTKEYYVDLSSPGEVDKRLRALQQRLQEEEDSVTTMEDFTRVKENGVPASDLLSDPMTSPYPVKSKFGKLTRSTGIHEGLTSLTKPLSNHSSGRSTPTRSTRSRPHPLQPHTPHSGATSSQPLPHVLVSTPAARGFLPTDVSTPIQGAVGGVPGAIKCPNTPVEIRKFLGTNNSGTGRFSPDGSLTADFSDASGSNVSSLTHSPTADSHREVRRDLKRKYEKDELWRAIKSDYHYLMDEDIIEQCRSTDSDLSWDDEDAKNAVTFTDFIQQYNELMEWLNQIQMFTQRQGSSLSEKYLNQSYYEEMLDRSPRRKLFNDYAKQLMRRYPNMRDEITVRLTHLNNQWERLQSTVAPSDGLRDRETMLRDLALDLQGLENWVNRIETTLQPRSLSPSLSLQQLQDMLKEHQELQQDIECHSKVVSAVLKLCERLHKDDESVTSLSEELQITALNLERRWHSIWLQSLEWQCRLEEAVSSRTNLLGRSLSDTHTRGINDSSYYDQSESRIDISSDESESGIQNDQSSQFSEASNAQTVTHDRAPSPGTSTLGRTKKPSHTQDLHSESHSQQRPLETDSSQNYLELPDPDTHILIADEESQEGDKSDSKYSNIACRPAEGKVRHWSEDQPRTGAQVERQYSTERRRRYSDSAHITVDSPTDYSPAALRSKSLDDLKKLFPGVRSGSSGSLDGITDDSDDLFDETEALLKSVASELRTYESFDDNIDDDDEFFIYSKTDTQLRGSQGLLSQFTTAESGLESVIEEEFSESDDNMSSNSPRRKLYSPGERVFASPKVKKFLQLQSFSNTVSPSTTPPNGGAGRRDSNIASDGDSLVEEGDLSIQDGQLIVANNARLTKDLLSAVPKENLPTLTTSTTTSKLKSSSLLGATDLTDCDLTNNNAIKEGALSHHPTLSPKSSAERTLYRLEEYNTKLDIQLRKGLDTQPPNQQFQLDNNLVDSAEDDYYYESSGSSYGADPRGSLGSFYLNRYSNREDLSKLMIDTDSAGSDLDTVDQTGQVSRLSLSPSDLRVTDFHTMESERGITEQSDELVSLQKASTDFGYVSGSALSELTSLTSLTSNMPTKEGQGQMPTKEGQGQTHSASVVLDISVPSTPPKTPHRHRLVEKTHKITQLSYDSLTKQSSDCVTQSVPVTDSPSDQTVTPTKPASLVVNVQSSVKSEGASPVINVQQLILDSLLQSSDDVESPNNSINTTLNHAGPRAIIISGLPLEDDEAKPPTKTRKLDITSKSEEVDPQFVSSVSFSSKPKSTPSKPMSPASFISKGGFTLKQHITEQGDQPYQNHVTSTENYTVGSVLITPLAHKSEHAKPDNYQETIAIQGSPSITSKHSLTAVTELSTDDDSLPQYSVLHGRMSRSDSIPHEHGSCDSSVKSFTIWETEVGLPANWSSVHVEPSTHKGVVPPLKHEKTSLSRSSSETYSTGYITPNNSYLKVTSVERCADNEEPAGDFTETIYINPSEVTKSANQIYSQPSEPPGQDGEEETNLNNTVTGIETVTTTLRPATKPRVTVLANQHVDSHATQQQTLPEKRPVVSTKQGQTIYRNGVTESDEHQYTTVRPRSCASDDTKYQDHEFVTVTPHRPHEEQDTPEEQKQTEEGSRFTAEASLMFESGTKLPYSENVSGDSKFVGEHRPTSSQSSEGDENENTTPPATRLSKQSVILSRKPLTSQENKTPDTKLEFTTTSIDNSDSADIDKDSRKQKPGTVYRILDSGLVVCESHPEVTEDLLDQSPTDSDGSEDHADTTHPSTDPSYNTLEDYNPPSITIDSADNDLSPQTTRSAIDLINQVIPESQKEISEAGNLVPALTIPDITVTSPSPLPEHDNNGDADKEQELTIPDITVTCPSPAPDSIQNVEDEESEKPADNVGMQPGDNAEKPLTMAEKLLADLDSMDGPEDATTAESLFDLITSMNPPGDVREISPTNVSPEIPQPASEDQPTAAQDNSEEKITRDDQNNLSDDSSHPDVCDSPLYSDDSHPDVYDSRLEDFMSSGVEELVASSEEEAGDVFRPISGDSEYDSENYIRHKEAGDTHQASQLVRPEAMKVERSSPQLIEALVSTTLTPLEMCLEEPIVPQHQRDRFREYVREQHELAVAEELSPLTSCGEFELTEEGLKKYLDNSMEASPVPERDPRPRPELADEDSIVPTNKCNVERPTKTFEPDLETPHLEAPVHMYSDTDEMSDSLEKADEVAGTEPTTSNEHTIQLLETVTESQSQTLAHPEITADPEIPSSEPTDADGENKTDSPRPPTLDTSGPHSVDVYGPPTVDTSGPPSVDTSGPPTVDTAGPPAATTFEPSPLHKNMSGISVEGGARAEPDSEAFDGDQSSEGDDNSQQEGDEVWPAQRPSSVDRIEEPFDRDSSVDTVRHKGSSESLKESSPDLPVRSTPSKRRRKRRPRTLTGSPKLHDNEASASPSETFPASHDLPSANQVPEGSQSANQEPVRPKSANEMPDAAQSLDDMPDDEQSADLSAEDEFSDVISSDNDELVASPGGLSEGSNWDYYQDPPYSTGTEPEFDIDLEPKLDDSVLQWDDELDDNDTLNTMAESRLPSSRSAVEASAASDSEDSDIEDLHYVIQQSSTQLLQADSALRKPRRDVVQSGIYLDPQKYIEWHATCQTNIKCLQVIQEHLESEQGLANLTDDDIQQVLDLIKKWQSLEKLALERKEQSTALCKIYRDIMSGKKLLLTCEEELAIPAFNDVSELETHFRTLQTFRANMQSQTHKLQQVNDAVLVFEAENKKIKMNGFKELIAELSSTVKPTILSVGKKTTDLQYAIVHWHKWNTDCKDLEASLIKTSLDIEPVELEQCEQRLVELEASFSEYSSVCTDAAHNYTEEKLASLRRRLNHLMSNQMSDQGTVPEPIPSLQLDELEDSPRVADEGEVPSDPDATLTRKKGKKKRRRKSPWALEDDTESNLSSQASPGSLEISPEKGDPFKSSMESGFATMDTERSHPGGSTDGDLPAERQQEPETSSPIEKRMLHEEEPTSEILQQSTADKPASPSDADKHSSPSDADSLFSPTAENLLSPNAAEDINSTGNDMLDGAENTQSQQPIKTQASMEPLTVDVEGHDTGTSDHQTPPTVEDLAPTLPITDQEKINVAKRSKKNKRNKRKKKSATADDSANALPPPVTDDTPLELSGFERGTDAPTCQDQSTSTDIISMDSVELQTMNTSLLADSSTNTDPFLESQSQTDAVPSNDQSTTMSPSRVHNQSSSTDPLSISNTANQTERVPMMDDSTSTIPSLSMQQQTDAVEDSEEKATNTPRKTDTESQTLLTASPQSSPRDAIKNPLTSSETQTDRNDDGETESMTVPTKPPTASMAESQDIDPRDSPSNGNSNGATSPSVVESPISAKPKHSKSSEKKKNKHRRKKGQAKYDAILREPTPEPQDTTADLSDVVSVIPDSKQQPSVAQPEDVVSAGNLPVDDSQSSSLIAAKLSEAEPLRTDKRSQLKLNDEEEDNRPIDNVDTPAHPIAAEQDKLEEVDDITDSASPVDDEASTVVEPVDDETVTVVEPAVKPQKELRQRKKKPHSQTLPETVDGEAAAAAAPKPVSRTSWFSARSLARYMAAVLGSLLFLFIILFLLEPRCCENTRYHKGIFGLRRQYSDLPPH